MKKYIVGIDLGTSSVKLFVSGGSFAPIRAEYEHGDMESGVLAALNRLYTLVPRSKIAAVGLSGQTGTYFSMQGGAVRHAVYWHEPGRETALAEVLNLFDEPEYIRMTGMRHPHLASYPAPTILHLQKNGLMGDRLLQPKDYILFRMTGEFASDRGSWRGLVNPATGRYDAALLSKLGISESQLPQMKEITRVSREGERRFGLPEGTPVYVGHNDFYSALHGIHADNAGDAFDITGTSEHFGVVTDSLGERGLTESPYLNGKFVRYGVTGSSGTALLWGAKQFGQIPDKAVHGAPIFLPYLNGERQIDPDPHACGMFVGLTGHTDNRALAYSVAEGVAMSVFRMYERLGRPAVGKILATGGATASPLLNRMKASLFGCPLIVRKPNCGSALGAVRAAGGSWESTDEEYLPDDSLRTFLLERYRIYRRLYNAWRMAVEDAQPETLFRRSDDL